jgi:PDZ domain-containing protein
MMMETVRRREAPGPLSLIGALLMVVVLSLAAWSAELPYLAFSPGPVSDAADAIIVEEVPVYPTDGELLMLTVISQEVNLFEAAIAGVDPTIDLVRKEAVRRPGETDEEYRSRVLQQMDDSTFRAITVALNYLGIEMVPVEVVIDDTVAGTDAARVFQQGDTLTAVNGIPVSGVADIAAILEALAPGDRLSVTVLRDGETLDLEVELAEREEEPGVPMIGVLVGELTEPPFPISIRAGDVGGPSAGMMHTLAIIDTLTEGELTRGHVIAGTGTIALDGTVGPIGGIRQKVVAAEAAGAEFILVPERNYQSALTAERESIEIIPIKTIEDAVEFLQGLPAS